MAATHGITQKLDCQTPYLVSIPAKAMLFGEYGVLFGGEALVVTLPKFNFELEAQFGILGRSPNSVAGRLSNSNQQVAVVFESQLLGDRLEIGLDDLANFSDSGGTGNPANHDARSAMSRFLVGALVPLLPQLSRFVEQGLFLQLRVTQAFAPSLGLGSSSALIVALYRAVHDLSAFLAEAQNDQSVVSSASAVEHVEKNRLWQIQLEQAWPTLYAMLKSAQGPGSGYDIAAQFVSSVIGSDRAGSFCSESRIFVFQQGSLPALSCALREVKADWFWKKAGCLIPSGIGAPTRAVLQAALQGPVGCPGRQEAQVGRAQLSEFAQGHASISSEALEILQNAAVWSDAARHPFADLFRRSLELAKKQGIAGHLQGMDLPSLGLLYKTMGAGCGDSVWCIAENEWAAAQLTSWLSKGAFVELN